MRATVFADKEVVAVIDRDVPKIGPDEVLVKSKAVGICHSDIELLEGRYILPFSYPITPGHEWAGEVAEVGREVTNFKAGDRVVGECVVGPGGRDHFGFTISGAMAQYFVAKGEWLHEIPASMSWTLGALVEPFSVAYNSTRTGQVDPSDRVAVLGAGPIGLMTALAAKGCGAMVVLFEPQAERRAKAHEIGITHALDPGSPSDMKQAAALTSGQMFDVVIESAGRPAAMATSLELAGHSARVVFVGIDVGGSADTMLGLIQAKSLKVQGIIGSLNIWPQTIRFLGSGVVDPTPIVSNRLGLEDSEEAIGLARRGGATTKVHVEVDS